MAAPDPDGMGLLKQIGDWLWALPTALAGILWHKADGAATKEELSKCLLHIEKLYQNAEKDRAFTRDLHDKAMDRYADGQRQIIDAISRLRP